MSRNCIKNSILFFLISILFFSCNNTENSIKYTLENNTDIGIKNTPIIISASELLGLTKNRKENEVLAVKNEKGDFIPFQIDKVSENQEEISFEIDLNANELKEVYFTLIPKNSLPEFINYTNVRLGKDSDFDGNFDDMLEETRDTAHKPEAVPVLYQMEGIAWENDKVGFRTYWDSRNGKDIFGKLIETPVLDTVGIPGTKSYHELNNWGMDILKVGNSLGAGAIAVYYNDSLIRLGETKSAKFKLICEGPVRAIIDLEYNGWIINNKEYTLRERITLWKGKYYYKSQLLLEGDTEDVQLVSGITNLHTDTFYTAQSDNYKILYTHDKQSENHDTLGMAIIVANDLFKGYGEAPNQTTGISNTYFVKMDASQEKSAEFYFVAGWEKTNKKFSSKLGFEKYCNTLIKELANPVSVEKIND